MQKQSYCLKQRSNVEKIHDAACPYAVDFLAAIAPQEFTLTDGQIDKGLLLCNKLCLSTEISSSALRSEPKPTFPSAFPSLQASEVGETPSIYQGLLCCCHGPQFLLIRPSENFHGELYQASASSNGVFSAQISLKGSKVGDASYVLGEKIAAGSEGEVFLCVSPTACVSVSGLAL